MDEKPDPLFTHPPPWMDQTIPQTQNKEKVESVKPKESLYGFLKKGTKVMSSKPIKAVSDSSKKPSWEINSMKKENIKIYSDNSPAQDVSVTLADETKIPTCQKKDSEQTGHIEILKEESASEINGIETIEEKKSNNGNREKYNENVSRSMYASLEKKMSKKKPINQDDINSEHPKRKNINLNNLVENISLRLSKGNKETEVRINEDEIDPKANRMTASIEKFKRLLSSDSNKQTIKKDSQASFSKANEEKIVKTNDEDTSIEEKETNKKELNINDKLKNLKEYKQKLFTNMKSNKQEEKFASKEKETTIGSKIKIQFESSKSKLTKNKKNTIEESNVINPTNEIESKKKKCSYFLKNEDIDKNNEICDQENGGRVSKASATLEGFKDPSTEEEETKGKKFDMNVKVKNLKEYKQKLLTNMKLNKQEEKFTSKEKEATIGSKIKIKFESSKSKLTKNKEKSIDESNEINQTNKIDTIKKKCSYFLKNEGKDKNNEICDKEKGGRVSKASAALEGFKLKLSFKGAKQERGQILKDKTLHGPVKKDLSKNKFSNIFPKIKETKTENENSIHSEKRIMNIKEPQMRKRDTKFQWIMIDGQWRKSESFGL